MSVFRLKIEYSDAQKKSKNRFTKADGLYILPRNI